MKYRPEIDGLRAVAVVPVILFHAGFSLFSGGYVGVDVFFVISGYLITTILINDLVQDRFSILQFYERRARRILPALCVVILACIPFAWFWMLPVEFKDFSQSLAATAVFISNIQFLREAGYFAGAAEQYPLLHTWSLAVEEQFYIFFPVLLWALWRFGRRSVFWTVALLSLASLGYSEWLLRRDPSANFYLIPSRVWELGAGALCALALQGGRRFANDYAALFGLLAIIAAIFVFDETTPFPSLYALLPVGGTALIILFAAPGGWVTRLLSWRVFVGIGLISYSAYLWHQPLFAFARLRLLLEPPAALMLGLAVLSLVLAYVTWRWVEQPFRHGATGLLPRRGQVFAASAVVLIAFVGLGTVGHLRQGANANAGIETIQTWDSNPCFMANISQIESKFFDCLQRIGDQSFYVLAGDSHAQVVSPALRRTLAEHDIGLITLAASACPPVTGTTDENPSSDCASFPQNVLARLDEAKASGVIFIARWTNMITGGAYTNPYGGIEERSGHKTRLKKDKAAAPDIAKANLVAHIETEFAKVGAHTPLMIVTQIPEVGWSVPKVAVHGTPDLLAYDYASYLNRNDESRAVLDSAATAPGVTVFPAEDVFCPKALPRKCLQRLNGELLYFDDDHVNLSGAQLLANEIVATLLPQ